MSNVFSALTLGHFLTLGAVLFCISVAGIFLNRKNVIILLMCIELMLLSVNINFIAFSREFGDAAAEVFAGLVCVGRCRHLKTVAPQPVGTSLRCLCLFHHVSPLWAVPADVFRRP